MKLSKNILKSAILSTLLLPTLLSPFGVHASTESLIEAAKNGIYLGSDYSDIDGGNPDVNSLYFLGLDKEDGQYKIIKTFSRGDYLDSTQGRVESDDPFSTVGTNGQSVYSVQTLSDEQLKTFGLAGIDFDNLSNEESTALKKIIRGTVTISNGTHTTAVSKEDDNGNVSYTINVDSSGMIASGNDGIVTGGAVFEYLSKNILNQDLSNLTPTGKQQIYQVANDGLSIIGSPSVAVSSTTDDTGKKTYNLSVIANGSATKGSTGLIDGNTLYESIKELPTDGAMMNKADKDAGNLTDEDVAAWQEALSDGVKIQKDNTKLVSGSDVYDYTHQQDISLGYNSTALNGSVAIGGEWVDDGDHSPTTASGNYSVAIGSGTTSTGNYSVALGMGAVVTGTDSVAIGSWTTNNEDGTVAVGDRRITQVRSAVKDSDAVNLGQMKEAIAESTDFKNMSDTNKSEIKNIVNETINIEGGEYNEVTPVIDEDGNVTYSVNTKINGQIENGNTGLVNGGDIYNYVKENTVDKDLSNISDSAKETIKELASSSINVTSDDHLNVEKSTDENGNTSISISVNTDGKAEKGNQGLITGDTLYDALKDLPTGVAMEGKANTDLDNISDIGKNVIKDIAKDSIKVIDGDNTQVIEGTDANGNKTFQVHALANGKLEEGNTNAVSGDTVKKALDEKADIDASNLTGHEESWANKLGIGKVEQGNSYLVTGDTVYNSVNEIIDKTSLVKSDGKTVTVAANDSATKVDFAGAGGNRVLTGINTDISDASSAVNVGYVNQLTEGIYSNLSSMKSSLQSEIYDATAKAGAIAALHPQEYDPEDKLDFAAGYGNYKGSNAAAIGAFYRPNENVTLNVGTTIGSGSPLVTAGVSLKLGKGSSAFKSRNAMASEIKNLQGRNKDLEEEVAYLEDQMNKVLFQLSALSVNSQMGQNDFSTSASNYDADKVFVGDKKVSRYEYAQMLYNALRSGKKIKAEQLNEYLPELKMIRQNDKSK